MVPQLILSWLAVIGLGAASAILPIMIFFGLVVLNDPGTGMIASALAIWWFPVVIIFGLYWILSHRMSVIYSHIINSFELFKLNRICWYYHLDKINICCSTFWYLVLSPKLDTRSVSLSLFIFSTKFVILNT